MATLHGFTVLFSGQRLCIVEMPDCWAIMNTLDAFPQAIHRFQKDEQGWREAVIQLNRSDAPDPTSPTVAAAKRAPVVANPALAKNPRRQFAISRIGIFITAVVLGLSVRMPWAVIHKPTITYKGDLFSILNHGWRTNVAQLLVAVAVFCAIQALAFPFKRIKMFSSISGIVALGLVLISITQIHTYVSPANFSNPKVSFGYGAFVALGTSAVLIMAWAVFPSRMRQSRLVPIDPLGQHGAVNDFMGTASLSGFGNPASARVAQ